MFFLVENPIMQTKNRSRSHATWKVIMEWNVSKPAFSRASDDGAYFLSIIALHALQQRATAATNLSPSEGDRLGWLAMRNVTRIKKISVFFFTLKVTMIWQHWRQCQRCRYRSIATRSGWSRKTLSSVATSDLMTKQTRRQNPKQRKTART